MAEATTSGDRARPRPPAALLVSLALVALALGLSAVWFGMRLRSEPLPVLGTLPPFELVGADGGSVSLASLEGSPWIADFIFTRCGGQCPAMTLRMSSLRDRLPERIRFVSFTVDPGFDTPEVLAAYASRLDPGDRWLFVTGPQPELYSLATDGFHLAAMEVPPDQQQDNTDGPFLHSSRFVLVDAEGRLRGYYDSTDSEAMERLVADAARLL